MAKVEIVERVASSGFPVKADGFRYSAESYLRAWRARSGFHQPDAVDYLRILNEFDLPGKVDRDVLDEVWLMAFPYAGYYESIMVGPGAFWCNAPPMTEVAVSRRFVIMGFNYERGVGEMLESFGHRAESIMARVYRTKWGQANLWERFTRHEKTHPGRAEVGDVHFAPNSGRAYDWGNPRRVLSSCDNWYAFPDLEGPARLVGREEWGGGDIRRHHLWWLRHFPHVVGETDGVLNNWWAYVLDPNLLE